MTSRARVLGALPLLLALVLVGGCQRESARSAPESSVVVFAAASLRDVFTELRQPFEQAHPGTRVTFNFAGTQELRAQVEHGAPADVFASADQKHMTELVRAGRAVAPLVFARNEPVLIVAKEAATKVTSLADLPNAARIVIGAPEVPIGRYTAQILERASQKMGAEFGARTQARIVSRELNVGQVLAKVMPGEADAGFVYRTDASRAKDKVSIVTLPPELNVIAEYPIAVLSKPAHPNLARAWVDAVLAIDGQRALEKAGSLAPNGSARAP